MQEWFFSWHWLLDFSSLNYHVVPVLCLRYAISFLDSSSASWENVKKKINFYHTGVRLKETELSF